MVPFESESELEEQLKEVGNKLSNPPSSIDELLSLLDKVENLLLQVEQSPSRLMQDALLPLMKALVSTDLLRHSDLDVKVSVASCMSEITRISAPDAPYNDEQMKEIFQLTVSAFENLSHEPSRCYKKAVSILDTVATVRSCLVMLDLECDAQINEMFQHFLERIRSNHPHTVFSAMESIMTLVIDESEDISVDLLKPLLASVRTENQKVSPVSYNLGEKVLTNCSRRLQSPLMEAVRSTGLTLDEFSPIILSIFQKKSTPVENDNVIDSGGHLGDEKRLTTEPVQGTKDASQIAVCPGEVCQDRFDASEPLTSNGDAPSRKIDGSSKTVQHSECIDPSGRAENAVILEVDQQIIPKKRGRKPNTLLNPEEGYDRSWIFPRTRTPKASDSNKAPKTSEDKKTPKTSEGKKTPKVPDGGKTPVVPDDKKAPKIFDEKRTPKVADEKRTPKVADEKKTPKVPNDKKTHMVPDGKKTTKTLHSKKTHITSPYKEIQETGDDCSPSEDPSTVSKTSSSLKQVGRTKTPGLSNKDSETIGVSSPSPAANRLSDGDVPRRRRQKKKKSIVDQASDSSHQLVTKKETSSVQAEEETPHDASIIVKIEPEERSEPATTKRKRSRKAAHSKQTMDDTIEKAVNMVLENDLPVASNPEKVEPKIGRKSINKKKLPIQLPSETKILDDSTPDRVVTQESGKKNLISKSGSSASTKDGGFSEETTKTNFKRKRTPRTEVISGTSCGEELVGKRIQVWWPLDKTFYDGVVDFYDSVKKKHTVLYTDGEKESLFLKKQIWKLIEDNASTEEPEELESVSPKPPISSDVLQMEKLKEIKRSTKKGKVGSSSKNKPRKAGSTRPVDGTETKNDIQMDLNEPMNETSERDDCTEAGNALESAKKKKTEDGNALESAKKKKRKRSFTVKLEIISDLSDGK